MAANNQSFDEEDIGFRPKKKVSRKKKKLRVSWEFPVCWLVSTKKRIKITIKYERKKERTRINHIDSSLPWLYPPEEENYYSLLQLVVEWKCSIQKTIKYIEVKYKKILPQDFYVSSSKRRRRKVVLRKDLLVLKKVWVFLTEVSRFWVIYYVVLA